MTDTSDSKGSKLDTSLEEKDLVEKIQELESLLQQTPKPKHFPNHTLQAKMAPYKKEIEKLSKQRDQLALAIKDDIALSKEKVFSGQQQRIHTVTQRKVVERDIDDAVAGIRILTQKIKQVDARTTGLYSEVEALETGLTGIAARHKTIEAIETEIKRLEIKIETELSGAGPQTEKCLGQIKDMKAALVTLQPVEDKRNAVYDLKTQRAELLSKLQKRADELAEFRERKAVLDAEIHKINADTRPTPLTEDARQTNLKKQESIKVQLDAAYNNIEQLTEEYKQEHEAFSSWRQDYQTKKLQLKSLKKRLKEIRPDPSQVRKPLKELFVMCERLIAFLEKDKKAHNSNSRTKTAVGGVGGDQLNTIKSCSGGTMMRLKRDDSNDWYTAKSKSKRKHNHQQQHTPIWRQKEDLVTKPQQQKKEDAGRPTTTTTTSSTATATATVNVKEDTKDNKETPDNNTAKEDPKEDKTDCEATTNTSTGTGGTEVNDTQNENQVSNNQDAVHKKARQLKFGMDKMHAFSCLDVAVPPTTADVQTALAALKEKKAELETCLLEEQKKKQQHNTKKDEKAAADEQNADAPQKEKKGIPPTAAPEQNI